MVVLCVEVVAFLVVAKLLMVVKVLSFLEARSSIADKHARHCTSHIHSRNETRTPLLAQSARDVFVVNLVNVKRTRVPLGLSLIHI